MKNRPTTEYEYDRMRTNRNIVAALLFGAMLTVTCISCISAQDSKKRFVDICEKLDLAAERAITEKNIDIPKSMIDASLEKVLSHKLNNEISIIESGVIAAAKSELNHAAMKAVDEERRSIEFAVKDTLMKQIGKLDISDLVSEVKNDAKDAVVEKLNDNMDDILENFNGELKNVGKIYASIADAMKR